MDKRDNHTKIDRIIFCVFLDKERDCYELLMNKFFPKSGDPVVALSEEEEDQMYEREERFEEDVDPSEDVAIKPDSDEASYFLLYMGILVCMAIGVYVAWTKRFSFLS